MNIINIFLIIFILATIIKSPKMGIFIFIFLLPFNNLIRIVFFDDYIWGLYWKDIFLTLLFIISLIRTLFQKSKFVFWGKGFQKTAIVFVLIVLIRYTFEPSLLSFRGVYEFLAYALFYLVTINVFNDLKDIKSTVNTLIVVSTISSIGAILFFILNIELEYISNHIVHGINQEFKRQSFLFDTPIHLGSYLALIAPVIWSLNSQKSSKAFLTAFILMVFALILTFSRGPWVQFSMAMLAYFGLKGKYFKSRKLLLQRWAIYSLLVVFLFIGFIVYFGSHESDIELTIGNRMESIFDWSNDQSNLTRFSRWGRSFDTFLDYPIWGIGLGRTGAVTLQMLGQDGWVTESMILKILVEMGLIGFMAYTLFYINLCKSTYHLHRWLPLDNYYKPLVAGLFSSFIGFIFEIAVLQINEAKQVQMVFWIFVALIALLNTPKLRADMAVDRKLIA